MPNIMRLGGGVGKKSILPEGYTQLEYIESTGTQYIDTGFKPNQDTRVVCDFQQLETDSNWHCIFGARHDATNVNGFSLWKTQEKILATYYGATGANQTFSSAISATDRHEVDKNKNITTIGAETITLTQSSFQCSYSLYLFACNDAGYTTYATKARVYSCQVYDNGTLIRDYVPCASVNGTGLYDLVNNVFYGFIKVSDAPVLLWTNASPTSAFAAQTVSIAGTDYDGFLLEFYFNNGHDEHYVWYVKKGDYLEPCFSGVNFTWRTVTSVTDAEITFGVGKRGSTTDNAVCIPTRIWGVKFTL